MLLWVCHCSYKTELVSTVELILVEPYLQSIVSVIVGLSWYTPLTSPIVWVLKLNVITYSIAVVPISTT